jgi:nicotinamidase-related amidase
LRYNNGRFGGVELVIGSKPFKPIRMKPINVEGDAAMILIDALQDQMPVVMQPLTLHEAGTGREAGTGLVIVDEVNGFASVGAGNLAPPTENPNVTAMVRETDRLARAFTSRNWPVLAFLDTHEPGKAEPPYPPHCERGTGEEDLVPELQWLEDAPGVTLIRKDCINGFIGATLPDGRNQVVDWVGHNHLKRLLVVGICTDICVMDFVLTMLSARNHGMMPTCEDILVHEGACATYDLPKAVVASLKMPETASHPEAATHHMGLYFMAARGAEIINAVEIS